MKTLIIFAKEPVPGRVKTRLADALGPKVSADIYAAFLRDLLDRFRTVGDRRVVAYTPDGARGFFQHFCGEAYEPEPQGDGDLGERMRQVFERHLAPLPRSISAKESRVVLIGSDSPTIPLGRVKEAWAALSENHVVIGPATDGGYYLLGCRGEVPDLFTDIAWGTSQVLVQTVQRLSGTNRRFALLDPWYDVDTLDDWRWLEGHVAAQRKAGLDPAIPHTEAMWAEPGSPSE